MEMQLLSNFTSTLLLFTCFIFLLIKALRKSPSPPKYEKLPPSPPKLPLIGHIHLLFGGLPHRTFRRLAQRYGPVVHLHLGEISTVVISSAEAAKEVMKVQDPACAGRPANNTMKLVFYNCTDVAFSPYNEHWRQMRKLCILELLSAKNVKSFGYIRQEEIAGLVKYLQSSSRKAVNLTEKIEAFTSSITCRAAFGKVMRDKDQLISMIEKVMKTMMGFELADLFPTFKLIRLFGWKLFKLSRIQPKIDAILNEIVEEHKWKKRGEFDGEDIVDVFLRMQKTGELQPPITTDNIKAVVLDMFAAGTESSSTTLVWAMTELMRNPRVMAKAQAEIRQAFKGKATVENSDVQELKYFKCVIKETLRLHPPFPLIPRQCREECKVDGYSIPINSSVIINVWSLGRDPKYWKDPEIFQPERFNIASADFLGNHFEFLPFGAGRRICPGLNFGLANLELPLAQLLYHFDWKLPEGMNPGDVDIEEGGGLSAARKNPLLLVPTIYDPST